MTLRNFSKVCSSLALCLALCQNIGAVDSNSGDPTSENSDSSGVVSKVPTTSEPPSVPAEPPTLDVAVERMNEAYYHNDMYGNDYKISKWYGDLTSTQKAKFEELYRVLGAGVAVSEEHARNLVDCLSRVYWERKVHDFDFSPEFIGFFERLSPPVACKFFRIMFAFIPSGKLPNVSDMNWKVKSKWFDVVSRFFCQLPNEEQTFESLHTMMEMHRIEFNSDGTRTIIESDARSKVRLRLLREALQEGSVVNMAGLRVLYDGIPADYTDLKTQIEKYSRKTKEAAFIAVTLPLLPLYILFNPPRGCCC